MGSARAERSLITHTHPPRAGPCLPAAEPGASAASGTSEAALAGEVKLLREELAAAQEAAAAATGHAKQFEALARTADEALSSMQAEHDKFKEEAAARWVAGGQGEPALRMACAAPLQMSSVAG